MPSYCMFMKNKYSDIYGFMTRPQNLYAMIGFNYKEKNYD